MSRRDRSAGIDAYLGTGSTTRIRLKPVVAQPRIDPELIAPQQRQEQQAIALATAFAETPHETGKVLRIFLATLIRKWDRESVQSALDDAAELAERMC